MQLYFLLLIVSKWSIRTLVLKGANIERRTHRFSIIIELRLFYSFYAEITIFYLVLITIHQKQYSSNIKLPNIKITHFPKKQEQAQPVMRVVHKCITQPF